MPPSRRQKLFEELGLMTQKPEPNPLAELGMDPKFARELLDRDESGAVLRTALGGMYRVVSRVYHTDGEGDQREGDVDRFIRATSADKLINKASAETLSRWIGERGVSLVRNEKMQAEQEEFMARSAELVRQNMELGGHPQHFSRLEMSQGVLLRHKQGALLMRETDEGVAITPGRKPSFDVGAATQSFHDFMRNSGYFGLKAGEKIAAYLDESGRTTILTGGLAFLMDVTTATRQIPSSDEAPWLHSEEPLLLTTQVPGLRSKAAPPAIFTAFLRSVGRAQSRGQVNNMTWRLPFYTVGSVEDETFFKRAGSGGATVAAAIGGAGVGHSANHFRLMSTSTPALVMKDARYSPLLAPGNSLLLFDPENRVPVVCEAQVMGMIGNGAHSKR